MTQPLLYLIVFFLLTGAVVTLVYLKNKGLIGKNRKSLEKTRIEDILKQLYHVEKSGRKANISELSNALRIRMVKMLPLVEHMSVRGLIQIDGSEIKLTEGGLDYALKIVRVHRLYEKYLSERTGFDKVEWHDRAERMEHQFTVGETEELARTLGFPRFDPHGDPIPTAQGEVIEINSLALSSVSAGFIGKIVHIEDEPEVIYRQIIAKDLHVGSQIKILESADNLLRFYSEGKEYELTPIVAANINVVALSEQEIFEENSERLSKLRKGESAKVIGISKECRGPARRRLLDLGFIPGTEIIAEMVSPMENPKAYLLRNTLIALRDDQAEYVLVEKLTHG